MNKLPQPIIEDLIELALRDRQIAYLEIDTSGTLVAQDGNLATFGFDSLQTGGLLEQQVDMFTGLLSVDSLPLYLPYIQTPSGITADIHLFHHTQSIWILLMHTEEKKKYHQAIQQKVYDLRLNHTRQTKLVNQYLGKEVAERLDEGLEQINHSGERRNLTTMFADLRGFTSFSEKNSPEQVFELLNTYLAAMIPVVLHEKGVLDKIIGDEVMAIFGMITQEQKGPFEALLAAFRMLNTVDKLNRKRAQQGKTPLQIGIGLATGPVSLGVLGSRHRKSLTVIGNHVNLAARLQAHAGPRQLIIDESTYQAIPYYQELFSARSVKLKGYSSTLKVYQFELQSSEKIEQQIIELQDDPTLY